MGQEAKKYLLGRLQLKAGAPAGTVTAVVSTFNVTDKDHDVVLPTAFTHGQTVPMVWSHEWTQPVGKGQILVERDQAVFDGEFFLNTQAGTEAYETVKAMAELQQWSWGFQVLESDYETRDGKPVRLIKKAQVFEVSPVLVGAGEHTRTLAVKAAEPEEKATDKTPDGGQFDKPVPDALKAAGKDDEAEPGLKASDFNTMIEQSQSREALWDARWKIEGALRNSLSSILQDADLDGPKKLIAVRTSGIQYVEALVNWTAQLLSLVDSGVLDLEEMTSEPAEVKAEPAQVPFAKQAEAAIAAAQALVGRSAVIAAARQKEGRVFSTGNRGRLEKLHESMAALAQELADLLEATKPQEPAKGVSVADLERRLRAAELGLRSNAAWPDPGLTNATLN